MNSFAEWTNLWFGCWSEFGVPYLNCPSIDDFVDGEWKYPNLEKLIQFLKRGTIIATTSRLAIPWAKGSGDGRASISFRTDGVWLWLDDLDYYITEHNVRPPDNFVKHIESIDFKAPQECHFDSQQLSWPPIK